MRRQPSASRSCALAARWFFSAVLLVVGISTTAGAQGVPVTDGLRLWLDAADPATFLVDGNGLIETWYDKSGFGFDATQSDPARRPAYDPTAMGGAPTLRFDGIDDGMIMNDALSVARPYSMFIVNKYWGGIRGRTLVGREGNWLFGTWNGEHAHYAEGWVSAPNTNYAGVDSPFIAEAIGSPLGSAYLYNGNNFTASPGPRGNPGRLGIMEGGCCGGEKSQADISEIVVYNRVLSHNERIEVGDYLANKYGIASNYPTTPDVGFPQPGVSKFTGAEPGQGLDLDGDFPYAVNVGGPSLQVGAVEFKDEFLSPGVVVSAQNHIPAWDARPDYGPSPANQALGEVMHSIRWSAGSNVTVNMDVEPGRIYKMQLLFSENILNRPASSRVMDVYVESHKVVDYLDLNYTMGQFSTPPDAGVLVRRLVHSTDNLLTVTLTPPSTPGGSDINPILNAFTLERIPTGTRVGTFTGGDRGEGLDLDGRIEYALNIRGPGGQIIRDAVFTEDGGPGTTSGTFGASVSAQYEIINWTGPSGEQPSFGASANDQALGTIMQSIRWTATGDGGPESLNVDLANLIVGKRYKVQLMFMEQCCDRGFDVLFEGELAVNDFSPREIMGGIAVETVGALVTHEFVATDDVLNIVLDGTNTIFPDRNPILDAVTLEMLPLLGDANDDGVVDRRDAAILSANYGTTAGAIFGMGDFNEDGAVDLKDLSILQQNLTPGPAPGLAVPEPSTAAMGLLAVAVLAGYRVRRVRMADIARS